jgi:hypothetical protein
MSSISPRRLRSRNRFAPRGSLKHLKVVLLARLLKTLKKNLVLLALVPLPVNYLQVEQATQRRHRSIHTAHNFFLWHIQQRTLN